MMGAGKAVVSLFTLLFMMTGLAAAAETPAPLTRGLGSPIAYTTRPTRAPISPCTHGGVRPVWAQGSSVT